MLRRTQCVVRLTISFLESTQMLFVKNCSLPPFFVPQGANIGRLALNVVFSVDSSAVGIQLI